MSVLYVISTPIGNLKDITLRALDILREADIVACEDTRTTGKLLSRYEIRKKLTSYHEHNEVEKTGELIDALGRGLKVALVTDAGTPSISDPGYRIVKAASGKGYDVIPVPGASAAVASLSVSGLPTSAFTFLGFPPRTRKKRLDLLERVKRYPETLVFYESPGRLIGTLEVIKEVFGDREACVSREVTKLHEEHLRGFMSGIMEELSGRERIKGEITIVASGASPDMEEPSEGEVVRSLEDFKLEGITLREAVRKTVNKTGLSKSRVYKMALEVWKE